MPAIFALLMGCGFLVSLHFTACNAIANMAFVRDAGSELSGHRAPAAYDLEDA